MSHLLPGSLAALDDTSISSLAINDVVTWNGIAWVNASSAAATTFLVQGEGINPFTMLSGNTLGFFTGTNPNHAFPIYSSVPNLVSLGWATPPTTGGTTQQTLIWDDNTDTYSWGAPISINPTSANYLSFNNDTRELSVSSLLITDVTVDAVSVDIAAYVATTPTHQSGDIVILTNATNGSQTWIHNGGVTGTITDYNQILDGASMSTFTIAGDSGTPQIVTDNNVVSILGGTAFTTVASNTNTITLDFAVPPTTGGATKQILKFNDVGDVYT
jgi:hypothetical protein